MTANWSEKQKTSPKISEDKFSEKEKKSWKDECQFCLDLVKEQPLHPALPAWVSQLLPSRRLGWWANDSSADFGNRSGFLLPSRNLWERGGPDSLSGWESCCSTTDNSRNKKGIIPEATPRCIHWPRAFQSKLSFLFLEEFVHHCLAT